MRRLPLSVARPLPDPAERPNHLIPLSLIELPYLDVGRAVYVITDEHAWLIAHGTAASSGERERVRARLRRDLDEHQRRQHHLKLG